MSVQKTDRKLRIVGVVLCLWAACLGLVRGDEYYSGGVTVDIDRDVLGYLWIADATANLHENAWIKSVYNSKGQLLKSGDVWAESGATLNIYGGKIDNLLVVTSSYNKLPEANVTVYGTDFAVNGTPLAFGTPEVFLQNQTLSGVYETGTPFAFNVECFWEGNFYLTVKLGWIASTPAIEVAQTAVDFGQVQVGQSKSAIVTVANTGDANLSLQSVAVQQADGADFGVVPLAQLPLTIEPDGTVELEVVFAPAAAGALNATLVIGSDDPETPAIGVALSGEGLVPVLTPAQQIAAICEFYAAGIKDGTILGIGPGKSAPNKAKALGKILECAKKLIDAGYVKWSLVPLCAAEKKTDGTTKPVDFVAGGNVAVLNAMIDTLIADIKEQ